LSIIDNFIKFFTIMPLFTSLPTNWNISETEAIALQEAYNTKVVTTDSFPQPIKYIGGIDVAYAQHTDKMVAAVAILDASTLALVEVVTAETTTQFPYIPTLFSFREIPPIAKVFEKLSLIPDIFICDGHGQAHPRQFGLACHLGVWYDVPTIGCGKSYLSGSYIASELAQERGSFVALRNEKGQEIGRALRTQNGINPLFVSVGHKISLTSACEWILRLSPQYRQPEPIRHADHAVRSFAI
jgi:deoxyribonuclease V